LAGSPQTSWFKQDPPIIYGTAAIEVASPSIIVVEDESIKADPPAHVTEDPSTTEPEPEPIETFEATPAEGENVATEISAANTEVISTVEHDSTTPIHEDPSPPIVIKGSTALRVLKNHTPRNHSTSCHRKCCRIPGCPLSPTLYLLTATVLDDNDHFAPSDLESVADDSALEDDKPEQDILAAIGMFHPSALPPTLISPRQRAS